MKVPPSPKIVSASVIMGSALLGAQCDAIAADLIAPKSVEYVKVCSVYGAGYFYIPGTDTCLKVGGFARLDIYANAVGTFGPNISSTAGVAFNGPGGGGFGYPFWDSDDPSYLTRTRAVVNMDARTQTDYGTLRSYFRFGGNWDSQQAPGTGSGANLYFERAFIQFAGFTFGYTQSFFDPGVNYLITTLYAGSNTWTTALAYTAQLGNGLSATISLEDAANRTVGVQLSGSTAQPIWNINSVATGLTYTNYQGGQQLPDIVGNIRLDQSWGSTSISGALHQVTAVSPPYTGFAPGLNSEETWGWAIGGHIELLLPALAKGDSLFIQANYAKGAVNYAGFAGTPQAKAVGIGVIDLQQVGGALAGTGAFYTVADAIATNLAGDLGLTTAWAVQAQFRHFWTPAVRSAFFGGYSGYEVPANIVAAQNFEMWPLGANVIWSPVSNLDIGTEIVYSKVDGSLPLGNYTAVGNKGVPIQSIMGGSTDVWAGAVRIQRNF